MTRPNSGIYLVSMRPVFDQNAITPVGKLDADNTSQLFANLILNHKENLDKIINYTSVTYCFSETDKNYLPDELAKNGSMNVFGNTKNSFQNIKNIIDKFFVSTNINLIVFANSIGVSSVDLKKILDLLTLEANAVVIGKTIKGRVSLIGFNYLNNDLIREINWDNIEFENLLRKVNKYDNFVYVWDNSLLINSVEDFKLLYSELSKKESLEYCSQQMHEKFTHIFIEYRELLK
jgi:hypothetical protein